MEKERKYELKIFLTGRDGLEKQPLIFIGNIKLVYYIINQFDDHALQDVGVNDEQFLNKYIYVHHKYIYLGKNKINFLQIKEVIK